MSKVAFILIGLPGSGKSTWANTYLCDYPHFSSDALIEKAALNGNQTYDEAFKQYVGIANTQFQRDVSDAIAAQKSFVIDRTNLSTKVRQPLVQRLLNEGYIIVGLVFGEGLDPSEHQRRLDSRPGKTIPKMVLADMANRFELPTEDEGFDDIIFIDGPIDPTHSDYWRIAQYQARERFSNVD